MDPYVESFPWGWRYRSTSGVHTMKCRHPIRLFVQRVPRQIRYRGTFSLRWRKGIKRPKFVLFLYPFTSGSLFPRTTPPVSTRVVCIRGDDNGVESPFFSTRWISEPIKVIQPITVFPVESSLVRAHVSRNIVWSFFDSTQGSVGLETLGRRAPGDVTRKAHLRLSTRYGLGW